MNKAPHRRKIAGVVCLAVAAVATSILAAPSSIPASADTAPPVTTPPTPATAAVDALPTAQIDGVVWTQAITGGVVYAGGWFGTARPAGSPPGVGTVPRSGLMSYTLATGALTSWNPGANSDVRVLAVSPDGRRLYAGGGFTTIGGVTRPRIAAFDTATGALIAAFAPALNDKVLAITATNDTVYVGGRFTTANGVPRTRLAAFRAADGALLGWAPSADRDVESLLYLTNAGASPKIVAGGMFTTVNGLGDAIGMTALDAASGTVLPWLVTRVVRNGGSDSGISSLTVDGDMVVATGWSGPIAPDKLEGVVQLSPADGHIVAMEDCHGDTYSAYPTGDVVYQVGHAHACPNVPGGFPELSPRYWQRSMAMTRGARGVVATNHTGAYTNFGGQPAVQLLHFYPQLQYGAVTGTNQAAWSITGSGGYLALGGEFPSVNGRAQQGLVRFATRAIAPNTVGPELSGVSIAPTATADPGGVTLRWTADWDRDNAVLTYQVIRSGDTAHPVATVTGSATYWARPAMVATDPTAQPGQTYTYRLAVSDPLGNAVSSSSVSVTVPAGTTYARTISADGPSVYWRFGEASGTTATGTTGVDGVVGAGVGHGAAGAILGDPSTAYTFPGRADSTVVSASASPGVDTYSQELWFSTTSRVGGELISFGSTQTVPSPKHDRKIFLLDDGRLMAGLGSHGVYNVASTTTYNDGKWHHVVATVGPAGLALYADGVLLATNPTATTGQVYNGYWHVGGDTMAGWPWKVTNTFVAGSIDEVAIYPVALTAAQVAAHFHAAGR